MTNNRDPHMESMEAAVFRRLTEHLRLRQDVSNIELMATAGFCRNCLADWLMEASVATPSPLTVEEARHLVYGEPYAAFKARQLEASDDQKERMAQSLAANARVRQETRAQDLDEELDEGFPASDPPSSTHPVHSHRR